MINEICPKESCLGCALCESECTRNAITMQIVDGFYRPIVSEACVSCGICIKNCPINNKNLIKGQSAPKISYAAWCKDDKLHFESSSGGLAYEIAYTFIQSGGFVVGIWYNSETALVEHRIYDFVDELHCMRGSRYVLSNKAKIYRMVAEKLEEKDGLFIGVPCEVYAMRQFVKHLHCKQDLYCIDLLCHGGASPQCLQEHMNAVSKGRKAENVTFRGGKDDCRLTVWGNNRKKLYSNGQFIDSYFLMFMKRVILQKACYSCIFAGAERVGDLTLGDFWGIDSEIEKQTDVRGINMLFINSAKGQKLIKKNEPDIVMIPRPIEEAVNGNDTLREPTRMPVEYEEFWKLVHLKGFCRAVKEIYGIDWHINLILSYLRLLKTKIVNRFL